VNQYFANFLKEKFTSTQFFNLKTNKAYFISFFDTTTTPIEFLTLLFKKFNCDIIFVVNIKNKEVTVYKNETSSIDYNDVVKKIFGKNTGKVFKLTNEFLGLTKHFTPL
jgi:hypothetical protein